MKFKVDNGTIRDAAVSAAGVLLILVILGLMAAVVPAQWTRDVEQTSEGREEAQEAARVFRQIMSKPDRAIPRELLERAEAVGIFPDVVKAAFIFGGRGGDGIVARRTSSGDWSVPVFYNISGASFGPQIGAKKTDYIMLFMNEGALRDLLDDKLELGAGVSVAAGPIGRTAGAGTNLTLDAGILTYSRSEGAFVGASIKGAVLTADNSVNKAIYNLNGSEILDNPERPNKTALPKELRTLMQTLSRYGGTKPPSAMHVGPGSRFMNTAFVSSTNDRPYLQISSQTDLAREIRSELLTMPYYSVFDWIEFDVTRDGLVTLRGSVVSPPDKKSAAERRVASVRGVQRVINNIEVLPLSPSDDRLRERLYREIYSGPLFRYQVGALQQIHIIVDRGHVTLKGFVDSVGDKNIAGIRAKTVSGTFSVDNQLTVDGKALS
ncbi:MAG TPA: YSC84-related protein [Pyrinomonadaceae bacterium]